VSSAGRQTFGITAREKTMLDQNRLEGHVITENEKKKGRIKKQSKM